MHGYNDPDNVLHNALTKRRKSVKQFSSDELHDSDDERETSERGEQSTIEEDTSISSKEVIPAKSEKQQIGKNYHGESDSIFFNGHGTQTLYWDEYSAFQGNGDTTKSAVSVNRFESNSKGKSSVKDNSEIHRKINEIKNLDLKSNVTNMGVEQAVSQHETPERKTIRNDKSAVAESQKHFSFDDGRSVFGHDGENIPHMRTSKRWGRNLKQSVAKSDNKIDIQTIKSYKSEKELEEPEIASEDFEYTPSMFTLKQYYPNGLVEQIQNKIRSKFQSCDPNEQFMDQEKELQEADIGPEDTQLTPSMFTLKQDKPNDQIQKKIRSRLQLLEENLEDTDSSKGVMNPEKELDEPKIVSEEIQLTPSMFTLKQDKPTGLLEQIQRKIKSRFQLQAETLESCDSDSSIVDPDEEVDESEIAPEDIQLTPSMFTLKDWESRLRASQNREIKKYEDTIYSDLNGNSSQAVISDKVDNNRKLAQCSLATKETADDDTETAGLISKSAHTRIDSSHKPLHDLKSVLKEKFEISQNGLTGISSVPADITLKRGNAELEAHEPGRDSKNRSPSEDSLNIAARHSTIDHSSVNKTPVINSDSKRGLNKSVLSHKELFGSSMSFSDPPESFLFINSKHSTQSGTRGRNSNSPSSQERFSNRSSGGSKFNADKFSCSFEVSDNETSGPNCDNHTNDCHISDESKIYAIKTSTGSLITPDQELVFEELTKSDHKGNLRDDNSVDIHQHKKDKSRKTSLKSVEHIGVNLFPGSSDEERTMAMNNIRKASAARFGGDCDTVENDTNLNETRERRISEADHVSRNSSVKSKFVDNLEELSQHQNKPAMSEDEISAESRVTMMESVEYVLKPLLTADFEAEVEDSFSSGSNPPVSSRPKISARRSSNIIKSKTELPRNKKSVSFKDAPQLSYKKERRRSRAFENKPRKPYTFSAEKEQNKNNTTEPGEFAEFASGDGEEYQCMLEPDIRQKRNKSLKKCLSKNKDTKLKQGNNPQQPNRIRASKQETRCVPNDDTGSSEGSYIYKEIEDKVKKLLSDVDLNKEETEILCKIVKGKEEQIQVRSRMHQLNHRNSIDVYKRRKARSTSQVEKEPKHLLNIKKMVDASQQTSDILLTLGPHPDWPTCDHLEIASESSSIQADQNDIRSSISNLSLQDLLNEDNMIGENLNNGRIGNNHLWEKSINEPDFEALEREHRMPFESQSDISSKELTHQGDGAVGRHTKGPDQMVMRDAERRSNASDHSKTPSSHIQHQKNCQCINDVADLEKSNKISKENQLRRSCQQLSSNQETPQHKSVLETNNRGTDQTVVYRNTDQNCTVPDISELLNKIDCILNQYNSIERDCQVLGGNQNGFDLKRAINELKHSVIVLENKYDDLADIEQALKCQLIETELQTNHYKTEIKVLEDIKEKHNTRWERPMVASRGYGTRNVSVGPAQTTKVDTYSEPERSWNLPVCLKRLMENMRYLETQVNTAESSNSELKDNVNQLCLSINDLKKVFGTVSASDMNNATFLDPKCNSLQAESGHRPVQDVQKENLTARSQDSLSSSTVKLHHEAKINERVSDEFHPANPGRLSKHRPLQLVTSSKLETQSSSNLKVSDILDSLSLVTADQNPDSSVGNDNFIGGFIGLKSEVQMCSCCCACDKKDTQAPKEISDSYQNIGSNSEICANRMNDDEKDIHVLEHHRRNCPCGILGTENASQRQRRILKSEHTIGHSFYEDETDIPKCRLQLSKNLHKCETTHKTLSNEFSLTTVNSSSTTIAGNKINRSDENFQQTSDDFVRKGKTRKDEKSPCRKGKRPRGQKDETAEGQPSSVSALSSKDANESVISDGKEEFSAEVCCDKNYQSTSSSVSRLTRRQTTADIRLNSSLGSTSEQMERNEELYMGEVCKSNSQSHLRDKRQKNKRNLCQSEPQLNCNFHKDKNDIHTSRLKQHSFDSSVAALASSRKALTRNKNDKSLQDIHLSEQNMGKSSGCLRIKRETLKGEIEKDESPSYSSSNPTGSYTCKDTYDDFSIKNMNKINSVLSPNLCSEQQSVSKHQDSRSITYSERNCVHNSNNKESMVHKTKLYSSLPTMVRNYPQKLNNSVSLLDTKQSTASGNICGIEHENDESLSPMLQDKRNKILHLGERRACQSDTAFDNGTDMGRYKNKKIHKSEQCLAPATCKGDMELNHKQEDKSDERGKSSEARSRNSKEGNEKTADNVTDESAHSQRSSNYSFYVSEFNGSFTNTTKNDSTSSENMKSLKSMYSDSSDLDFYQNLKPSDFTLKAMPVFYFKPSHRQVESHHKIQKPNDFLSMQDIHTLQDKKFSVYSPDFRRIHSDIIGKHNDKRNVLLNEKPYLSYLEQKHGTGKCANKKNQN